MLLPTRFWITKGIGESDISALSALDDAFMEAGIGYQNHVIVSSIPPATEIQPKIDQIKGMTFVPVVNTMKTLQPSSIIYVVRSLNTGVRGEEIAASIALAKVSIPSENKNNMCSLAFESHGHNIKDVEEEALAGLKEMIERRKANVVENWGDSGFKTVTSHLVVEKSYGCAATFVVFDPFTFENKI